MEQLRQVDGPEGTIRYWLTRKRVRNLNLRLDSGGEIHAMRSQWGNCHWMQGYITLNTALVRCPPLLRDYVALHELVHFLHHDHGPGFYAVMDALMPQWRQLRQELKRYAVVLR